VNAARPLSALGLIAVIALALGVASSTALSLRDARASADELRDQDQALQEHEKRLAPRSGRDANAAPLFEARTITQAGANVQQRLEAAIAAAHGRLMSSKVEVAPRQDESRLDLSAELTVAEPDLQALLFDLEVGRPYLFVNALAARVSEPADDPQNRMMRVSLSVSGQWSQSK
jgi:general secretion pathway protein M